MKTNKLFALAALCLCTLSIYSADPQRMRAVRARQQRELEQRNFDRAVAESLAQEQEDAETKQAIAASIANQQAQVAPDQRAEEADAEAARKLQEKEDLAYAKSLAPAQPARSVSVPAMSRRPATVPRTAPRPASAPARRPAAVPRPASAALSTRRPQTAAPAAGNEIALPASLQALPNVTIKHLRVNRQSGVQCGSRAVANALAIQKIVENEGPEAITSENIQRTAGTLKDIISNKELHDGEVLDLIIRHKINNMHILGFNRERQMPYLLASVDDSKTFDELVPEIQRSDFGITHFIYCTGTIRASGHYTLITLIKEHDKQPTLIFMDSMNNKLEESSTPTIVIKWMTEWLIVR